MVPQGRTTRGNCTLILGALELDLRTRKLTGKAFLRVIGGESRPVLEPIVKALIRERSDVWTDNHPVFGSWLSEIFSHVTVIHKRGQMVTEDGEGTNAAKGMFARVKRMLRTYWCRAPAKNDYGAYLAKTQYMIRNKENGK